MSFTGHFYDESGRVQSWKPINLDQQVNDKLIFLENGLFKDNDIKNCTTENSNIILIGHSIGCYAILELLSSLNKTIKDRIKRAFLFMPTIERMSSTPNGKRLTFLTKYFLWFIYFITYSVSFLPGFMQKWIVSLFIKYDLTADTNLVDGLGDIIFKVGTSFSTVRSCVFMGADEMGKVNEPNRQSIEENLDLLTFYYGTGDRWCPINYFYQMKDFIESLKKPVKRNSRIPAIVLDEHGLDHELIVYKNQCSVIANFVSNLI